jgi:hypothetical protein
MADDNMSPKNDPFGPPAVSTVVQCLHCGEQYDSYLIEWRVERSADGKPHGFWCCPIAGCDGKGFGFDILPIDPHYRDEHGEGFWDDEEGDELDELDEEWADDFEFGDTLEFEPVDKRRISPTSTPCDESRDDDIPF